MWRLTGPIILATSVVGSTAISKFASDSGWLVFTGPLVMAIALVAVAAIDHRLYGASRNRVWIAIFLGGIIILASVIVAQSDPAKVASNIGVLGGGVSAVFIWSNRNRGARRDGDAGKN